jgi:hypothetical protein
MRCTASTAERLPNAVYRSPRVGYGVAARGITLAHHLPLNFFRSLSSFARSFFASFWRMWTQADARALDDHTLDDACTTPRRHGRDVRQRHGRDVWQLGTGGASRYGLGDATRASAGFTAPLFAIHGISREPSRPGPHVSRSPESRVRWTELARSVSILWARSRVCVGLAMDDGKSTI